MSYPLLGLSEKKKTGFSFAYLADLGGGGWGWGSSVRACVKRGLCVWDLGDFFYVFFWCFFLFLGEGEGGGGKRGRYVVDRYE